MSDNKKAHECKQGYECVVNEKGQKRCLKIGLPAWKKCREAKDPNTVVKVKGSRRNIVKEIESRTDAATDVMCKYPDLFSKVRGNIEAHVTKLGKAAGLSDSEIADRVAKEQKTQIKKLGKELIANEAAGKTIANPESLLQRYDKDIEHKMSEIDLDKPKTRRRRTARGTRKPVEESTATEYETQDERPKPRQKKPLVNKDDDSSSDDDHDEVEQ